MALTKRWTLIFSVKADRDFQKLDKSIQQRILKLFDKVLMTSNPKFYGKQLQNRLSPFWVYRAGDYRVICRLENNEFIIVAVKIGHRSEVYDFKGNE